MEEKIKESGGSSAAKSASTPPYKKIRIPKVEEEIVGTDREKVKNPLNIPEIIAIVAGHINKINDLKGVRTQSKAWKDETFLKWRNSAVFLINDETIPILVKAFEPTDLADLSEEDKATTLKEKDPFGLQPVPFKNYRFANARNGQPWSYPLDRNDFVGKIIWDEVIIPHATYLDVGECVLKKFFRAGIWKDFGASHLPGLNWILKHSPNVRELAMAPLQSSNQTQHLSYSDEDEEEEVKELRRSLRNEVECRKAEIGRRVLNNMDLLQERLRRSHIISGIKKALEAPQIHSLTISTPQQFSVRDDDTTLKPLTNFEDRKAIYFSKWLFGGMLNLKHLQLPTGFGSTLSITGLNHSRYENATHLESLHLLPDMLNTFISLACIPLPELRMSLKSTISWSNLVFNDIFRTLRSVKKTIEKLEFEVYSEIEEESKNGPINYCLRDEGKFLNLFQFKITLDNGHFQKFHFELNTMPNLQSFHFGKKVPEAWTDRKLKATYNRNLNEMNRADEELPSLEEFHFNGNLTRKALWQVGKMTKNLKTLELVLDQENLPALQEICPRLTKLTLPPGSDVPEEVLHSLKKSYQGIDIIDKSKENKGFV